MNRDQVCLCMIAKSSDEDFIKSIESAVPFASTGVVVVAPGDPLLKWKQQKFEGIKLYFMTHPWVGYAQARNFAIAAAESLFKSCADTWWALTLDTGDTISGKFPLISHMGNREPDAFSLTVTLPGEKVLFQRRQLFRGARKWRWICRVDEIPESQEGDLILPSGMSYHSTVGTVDYEENMRRIALGMKDAEEGVMPARAWFYVGRRLAALGEHGPAIQAFSNSLNIDSALHEQTFWAWMGLGRSMNAISLPYDVRCDLFQRVVNYFPQRAEALRELHDLYDSRAKSFKAAADKLGPPKDAVLWVEADAYVRS